MKKLILALSFVFVMGLVAVNAQVPVKKVVKKEPAKTEAPAAKAVAKPAETAKPAVKKAVKAKKAKKVVAPAKKEAAPVKK